MNSEQRMFTLKTSIECAHSISEKNGSEEPIHGHSWGVTVRWIIKNNIDEQVRNKCSLELACVVQQLDHRYLNDQSLFQTEKPTAEAVAEAIFKRLYKPDSNVILASVRVEEEAGCSVKYINPLLDTTNKGDN